MEVTTPKIDLKSDATKAVQKHSNAQGLLNQIKQLGDVVFAGLMDSLKTDPSAKTAKASDSKDSVEEKDADKEDAKDKDDDSQAGVAADAQVATATVAAAVQPAVPVVPVPVVAKTPDKSSGPKEDSTVAAAAKANVQADVQAKTVSEEDSAATPAKPTPVEVQAVVAPTVAPAEAVADTTEVAATSVLATTSAQVPAEVQKLLEKADKDEDVPAEPVAPPTASSAIQADAIQTAAQSPVLATPVQQAAIASQNTVKSAVSAAASAAGVEAASTVKQTKPTDDIKDSVALSDKITVDSPLTELSAVDNGQKAILSQTLPLLQSATEYLSLLRLSLTQQNPIDSSLTAGTSAELTKAAATSAIGGVSAASAQSAFGFTLSSNAKSSGPGASATKELLQSRVFQNMDRVENALKEALKSKDGSTLSFRLDPPSLGTVRVDVSMKDNMLVARVGADHPEVQQLLKERTGELQQALARTGMDIERIKIIIRDQPAFEQFSGSLFQGDGQKEAGQGKKQSGSSADFAGPELDYTEVSDSGIDEDHWVA